MSQAFYLIDVYKPGGQDQAERILWQLLSERDGNHEINISHRKMPEWTEHTRFVRSRPYHAWYLITLTISGDAAGAIYLSKQNEIGIHLFRHSQGRGLGPRAIEALMNLHPRDQYLANINPKNAISLEMFAKLEFKVIQITMSKE